MMEVGATGSALARRPVEQGARVTSTAAACCGGTGAVFAANVHASSSKPCEARADD